MLRGEDPNVFKFQLQCLVCSNIENSQGDLKHRTQVSEIHGSMWVLWSNVYYKKGFGKSFELCQGSWSWTHYVF